MAMNEVLTNLNLKLKKRRDFNTEKRRKKVRKGRKLGAPGELSIPLWRWRSVKEATFLHMPHDFVQLFPLYLAAFCTFLGTEQHKKLTPQKKKSLTFFQKALTFFRRETLFFRMATAIGCFSVN